MTENTTAYDVIVVGAGTTGCVLASRLSEDPNRSVLLIEAGSMPEQLTRQPIDLVDDRTFASMQSLMSSPMWHYRVRHDRVGPRVVVRGKVIGGSGAVNAAYFLRGTPDDYDSWGSPLWTWDAVLPFFTKMECDRDFSGAHHGDEGPVTVERVPRDAWRKGHVAFEAGALEQGYAAKPDINHPDGEGVGPMPRNMRDGYRVSAAVTHLEPALGRANLEVRCETRTQRIVIEGGVATGVVVLGDDGTEQTVSGREVVLCAGALETPSLLLRSGIGPARVLEKAGVAPVHVVEAIGQNLRDHPAVIVDLVPDAAGEADASSAAAAVVMAYSSGLGEPGDRLDMQIFPHYADTESGEVLRSVCVLENPISSGSLELEQEDGEPTLEFRFLRDDRDVDRLVDAARRTHAILTSEAAQRVLPGTVQLPAEVLTSDEAAREWVEATVFSLFHSIGTCSMGAEGDPDAVVDDHGRVYGLEALRIADLSIVPKNIHANPNATAFMIAERIAALMAEPSVNAVVDETAALIEQTH